MDIKKQIKEDQNRGASIRFKAAMILLFNDIDMFGDITRARRKLDKGEGNEFTKII